MRYAIGILVKDRWDLTVQCLKSIYFNEQTSDSYDIYIIDNNSNDETKNNLKKYCQSTSLPIKNIIFIPEINIPSAWNLFLGITSEYRYRVKLDNDIVIHKNTPMQLSYKDRHMLDQLGKGVTAGGGNVRVGATRIRPRRRNSSQAFMTEMQKFSQTNNADIVALPCIGPTEVFNVTYNKLISAQLDGLPYLQSGCMLITKRCFKEIGYFDERLDRESGIEYTQRAIKNKLNIGYCETVHCLHVDEQVKSTEINKWQQLIISQIQVSRQIRQELPAIKFVPTKFEGALNNIKQEMKKYRILSIN